MPQDYKSPERGERRGEGRGRGCEFWDRGWHSLLALLREVPGAPSRLPRALPPLFPTRCWAPWVGMGLCAGVPLGKPFPRRHL